MTWADRGTLAVHARKADGSSSGSWPGCSSRGSGRNAKWTRSKWPPSGVGISKWRWPWSWRLQRGTRPRRCRRCGHLASEPSAGRAGSRESDVAARPLLLLSEQARALLSHWRDDCVSLPWHAPCAHARLGTGIERYFTGTVPIGRPVLYPLPGTYGNESATLRKGQLNRQTQGTDQPLPHETQDRLALSPRSRRSGVGGLTHTPGSDTGEDFQGSGPQP